MMRSHDYMIRVTSSPLGMKLMLRVTSAPLEPKFSVIEKCATVLHIFLLLAMVTSRPVGEKLEG